MVKRIFKNGTAFFLSKQADILSAATIIMFMSLASGFLGLVRDRLMASHFTPDLVGIYFAAFRLPDFAFQVLIFGALSVAFIPVFTNYWQKDEKEAWQLAASLLNIAIVAFILIILVFFLFLKPLSFLLVPGLLREKPEHLDLFLNLTRIILLSQLFFVFSSFLTGILQSSQRFLLPAVASVFYNLGIIAGIIFLVPIFGIYGVMLGVILGAFFHFLIQLPLAYKLGFRPQLKFNLFHPGVKEIGRLMLPRSLALAAQQTNLFVNTALASLISLSSITFLTFAQHLAFVPLNLFGTAISQAAFPTLSVVKNQNKIEEFKSTLLLSLHQILFLTVPAVTALFILHTPLTRLVFGARLFTWEATFLTGWTLAFLSLGIIAQAGSSLLMRAFYAIHDTKTPLKVNLITVGINVLMSIVFIRFLNLPVWSLGISASLGAFLNLFFLLILLDGKVDKFNRRELLLPAFKILTASLVMAFFLWGPLKLFDQLVFDTKYTVDLIMETTIVSIIGLISYLFLAWLLEIKEAEGFLVVFRKIGNWRRVLSQQEELLEEKI